MTDLELLSMFRWSIKELDALQGKSSQIDDARDYYARFWNHARACTVGGEIQSFPDEPYTEAPEHLRNGRHTVLGEWCELLALMRYITQGFTVSRSTSYNDQVIFGRDIALRSALWNDTTVVHSQVKYRDMVRPGDELSIVSDIVVRASDLYTKSGSQYRYERLLYVDPVKAIGLELRYEHVRPLFDQLRVGLEYAYVSAQTLIDTPNARILSI